MKSDSKGARKIESSQQIYTKGRLPQAPSSLLVQLPPNELRKLQNSAIHGANNNDSFVEASDVQLLATSIQQRREKERRVFVWQQRLIDADESLLRADLKRGLTQLSLSSWLQVLQERHLDGRCAYPGCSRKPKRPHLSSRETILSQDAPRYRISLSSQSIRRDERDDPGGENGYCSKACWRRGEWISRWVLEGTSAQQAEKEKRKVDSTETTEGIKRSQEQGLGKQVDEGGRWERLIEEEDWERIEILEDLEEKGEIDRLSDDESVKRRIVETKSQNPSESSPRGMQSASVAKLPNGASLNTDLNQFSTMLDSLTIKERPIGTLNPIITPAIALEENIGDTVKSDLIKGSLLKGSAADRKTDSKESMSTNLPESKAADDLSDADSDDLDVLGELNLQNATEDDGIASAILRSSRHLQRAGIEEEEDDATIEMTKEERKRQDEEDDIFALAWQARDEEIAKGTWIQ